MNKKNEFCLIDHLKDSGYKITNPRRIVLEVLAEHSDSHLSTEEIYAFVKKAYPKIGLASVYRILLLLTNVGVVSKLELDDGLGRYELCKPNEDHRHHHLICSNCGNVAEVDEDMLDCLEEQILLKNKFLVKDHRVKFYGICEKCRV